jgi:predicted enzyme related to lactoylglutathione lyase
MLPRIRTTELLVPICLLVAGGVAAQGDAQQAHGIFTGEVKPVIYVTDVEKSAPFYRDVLGFEFHDYAEHEGKTYYAEMSAGGLRFGLHIPMTEAQRPKVGQQRVYFRVEDLELHRSRVVAWDRSSVGEIVKTDWMDMFLVEDPDGNEIVFALTDPERHPINPW